MTTSTSSRAPARSDSRSSRTPRISTPSSCPWVEAVSSRVSRSRSRPSTPRFRSSASSPIGALRWRRRWRRARWSRSRRPRRSPTASPCPQSAHARSRCSGPGSTSSSPCPSRTSLSRCFAWLRPRSLSRRERAPRGSPRASPVSCPSSRARTSPSYSAEATSIPPPSGTCSSAVWSTMADSSASPRLYPTDRAASPACAPSSPSSGRPSSRSFTSARGSRRTHTPCRSTSPASSRAWR